MTTAKNHAELSLLLRDALMHDASAFVDALYDVEHIPDDGRREIVIQVRDQTKLMFERSRARLAGAAVEIIGETRDGDRYMTQVQVEGGPKLEITVDDVYERDGGLRTHDLVRISQI